jgi:Ataxin-3
VILVFLLSRMASFDNTPLYFEPQAAALCGRHSVNNLLQGPFYSEVDLSEIARELDDRERDLMMVGGTETADALRYMAEESFNVDDSGNFSISVLREAVLRSHGIMFDCEPPQVARALQDPNQFEGFLLNLDSHWFCLRKLSTATGRRWFNLNSLQKIPTVLGDFFVSAFLAQMKQSGYSIFVVIPGPLGRLPDPVDTSQGEASCWRRVGDVLAQAHAAEDARHSAAARAQQSAVQDPEFEAALQASLVSAGVEESHKRPRPSARVEEENSERDFQAALRLSLLATTAPEAASGSASAGLASPDDPELAAALALSLSGGDSSAVAVPVPRPSALTIAAISQLILHLRSALAAEDAAAAPVAGASNSARLQVKLPLILPCRVDRPSSETVPRGAPAPQHRRFELNAPLSAVLDWAALCWLEAAFPEALAVEGVGTADVDAVPPEMSAFQLCATMPPIVLCSSSVEDRARTVRDAGLAPSASLTLRPIG